jgi:hypothetical protein
MNKPPRPLSKRLKSAVVGLVMWVLGRALQSAWRWDPLVRAEANSWPEGVTILMRVMPWGPRLAWAKRQGRIRHLGGKLTDADLVISFKNIEGAFLVFLGLLGSEQGFAQHRMYVKGDLPLAVSLIRCVNQLEAYLFPRIITTRILKRVPRLGWQGNLRRLAICLLGIPLGI